ncbi:hypothetical protein CBS147323_416 [Aspergillus niger]|nr:hypothetical protein CBS147323_416 [Aspergillus niger]KAI3033901.1 hypothetical protein CBS147347_369 [Aspergillus niger]
MPLSGHCLCKAVTYTVDIDAPLLVGYDHCDDCQRQSGSTYSLVAVVPKDKLTVNGPLKKWSGTGSSGNAVHRLFCSECGSPIAHDPDAAPEIIALKAGTLDTEIKKALKPDTEIWTVGKLPFCQEHLAKPFKHMPESLLLFGGHSLEQLSEIDLEDVLHRLVSGSYPTMPHMDGLSHKLTEAMLAVPDDVQRTVWTHPTSSPLPLIVAGMSACLASHPDMITASHDANMFRKSPEDTDRVMIRTVAAYAVVSGLANSHRKGLRFTPPTRGRSYYEKSFVMAGLVDPRTGRPGRVKLSCFRQFDILNSDHGMAFTVFSALATP